MASHINRRRIRANIVQEDSVLFNIPLNKWRRVGDMALLPTAGDATNLGYVCGTLTFGSGPKLQGSNAVGNAKLEYARCDFMLPECYVAGQAITFRARANRSAAANTANTLDLEVYTTNDEGGFGADICATAAQNLNAAFTDHDFTITPTGLVAGDGLIFKLISNCNDTGGAIGSQHNVGATKVLLSIKG